MPPCWGTFQSLSKNNVWLVFVYLQNFWNEVLNIFVRCINAQQLGLKKRGQGRAEWVFGTLFLGRLSEESCEGAIGMTASLDFLKGINLAQQKRRWFDIVRSHRKSDKRKQLQSQEPSVKKREWDKLVRHSIFLAVKITCYRKPSEKYFIRFWTSSWLTHMHWEYGKLTKWNNDFWDACLGGSR